MGKPQKNIQKVIDKFLAKSGPDDRYTSFDYCYTYFQLTKPSELGNDVEKGCLTLGFYLASWGMLRGSSFLLNRSVKHFQPTIEFISKLDKSVWHIDVNTYNDNNMQIILELYKELTEKIGATNKTHRTLVTKIMLGVFGNIPAFDQYFVNTFSKMYRGQCSFTSVSKKSLTCLKDFYDINKSIIDKLSMSTFTTDFSTGKKTKLKYPRAKIIDMYGFTAGQKQRTIR